MAPYDIIMSGEILKQHLPNPLGGPDNKCMNFLLTEDK